MPRQRFLQKIAEPLIRLGVIAIGERVAQKEESIRRNITQLSLAQSKTVVPHRNRTIAARLLRGGVWHGDPAELRIKLKSLAEFEAAWPAEIDDAKQKFGGKKYRDNDRAQYEQTAQQRAAAAALCRHIGQRLLHGHPIFFLKSGLKWGRCAAAREKLRSGHSAEFGTVNPARTRPGSSASRRGPVRP